MDTVRNKYVDFEDLNRFQESYALLVEGVLDYAIYMITPEGIVATWNLGAERIKGYSRADIIGQHFSKFYTQEDRLRNCPEKGLVIARRNGRFQDEGWRVRKNGNLFWANVIITPIYNESKELIGFSKITKDLTEKKKLEDELRRKNRELKESEERCRLLISTVKDYGIIFLSDQGNVVTWNEGAERIKGYTSEEVIGKHFSIFYTQDAVQNKFPEFELRKALTEGRFEDEGWRIRKDGTLFWANVVITPVYNELNKLIGYSKIIRDLSEKKRRMKI